MTAAKIEVGDVYQPNWHPRPIRVIAHDEHEVLYDSWWPKPGAWGFALARGAISYYRIPVRLLADRAERLGSELLTPDEWKRHRPDLSLRLCRSAAYNWSSDRHDDMKSFAALVARVDPCLPQARVETVLPIPSVVLLPFGPKGGHKKGVMVEAADPVGFTSLELLRAAHNLQSEHVRSWTQGVGLYRDGLQKGIPSYYIWGWRDKAGHLT